jgi:hypothetical protein
MLQTMSTMYSTQAKSYKERHEDDSAPSWVFWNQLGFFRLMMERCDDVTRKYIESYRANWGQVLL